MKSLLLPFAILLSIGVTAQIPKGTVLLGGNISGFTTKNEVANSSATNKQSGILISPSIGVATKENTVWGINLGYSSDETKNEQQTVATTSKSYSAGVFTRRYMPVFTRFYLYGQAGVGYSKTKQDSPQWNGSTSYSQDSWGINMNAFPGIAYSITKRMQLELGLPSLLTLGYGNTTSVWTTNNINTETTQKGFSFTMNLNPSTQLAVGFRILIGK